ncbi:MAG: tRNA guanosine(34) transglycosylase Tgt [Planctomycetota bacterium]
MSGSFAFTLHSTCSDSRARRATFATPHGPVETPAFMPVATQGSVKGLEVEQVRATGAQIVLANTYHLALRPGEEVVAALGGLHRFIGWDGPILTDSGGFQVFSLADCCRVSEEGVTFRSHIDGQMMHLTPERAVAIQEALGSDVAMVLDHVVALPNEPERIQDASERSVRWADRCLAAARRSDQILFAIVQGGLDGELRHWCAERLVAMGFPGYAVGGLSVGEPPAEMYRVLDGVVPSLPDDRPRYLMGVGRPEDLLEAIQRGVDLFDCVMPTRNGRNAMAFTDEGPLRLRNLRFQRDEGPLQPGCPCAACRRSRGYLRHLFMAGEMLGPILLSIHNLTYYHRLLADARRALEGGRFLAFCREKRAMWRGCGETDESDDSASDGWQA